MGRLMFQHGTVVSGIVALAEWLKSKMVRRGV